MSTSKMMYPTRGGLVWGHMKGCYLQLGGQHPLGGLYNILTASQTRNTEPRLSSININASTRLEKLIACKL